MAHEFHGDAVQGLERRNAMGVCIHFAPSSLIYTRAPVQGIYRRSNCYSTWDAKRGSNTVSRFGGACTCQRESQLPLFDRARDTG